MGVLTGWRYWGSLAVIVLAARCAAAGLPAEEIDNAGYPTTAYKLAELLRLQEPIGRDGLVQIIQAFRYSNLVQGGLA
jgi:hypothetical protein